MESALPSPLPSANKRLRLDLHPCTQTCRMTLSARDRIALVGSVFEAEVRAKR